MRLNEASKQDTVHYELGPGRVLCMQTEPTVTRDKHKVTCKRCLRKLKKGLRMKDMVGSGGVKSNVRHLLKPKRTKHESACKTLQLLEVREAIKEVLVKARSAGSDPYADEFDYWEGDAERIKKALVSMGVPSGERDAIVAGIVPVTSNVLSTLKNKRIVTRQNKPHRTLARNPFSQPRKMSERSAEKRFAAAIRRFAKNWTDFKLDMPDVAPSEAAWDAAEGFFFDNPEWEKWASAMKKSKNAVREIVTDWVFDAMETGRVR